MFKRNTKVVAGVVAAAALLTVGGASGAMADKLITGHDIKDGSISRADLNGHVNTKLDKAGERGPAGHQGVTGKDGVTDLNAGAGYTHTWAGDGGANLNAIVAKCDPGQQALSGGFSTWGGSDVNESGLPYDLGGDNKSIQVTVSAPYTGEAYDETKYHGNIRPDRWVVKGYNNGDTDQIVRAWVVCATVTD
jgi:hypothetical protein